MLGGTWQASDSHGLSRGTGTRVDTAWAQGANQPSPGLWLAYLHVWFPKSGGGSLELFIVVIVVVIIIIIFCLFFFLEKN